MSIRSIPPRTTTGPNSPPGIRFGRNLSPKSSYSINQVKPTKRRRIEIVPDVAFDEEFQLVPELTKELEGCLVAFPEVNNIQIRAMHNNELSGNKGTYRGEPIIILFVPDQVWGKWSAMRPIIYHELSHFIGKNSEETEKVFFERADPKSQELWRKLQEIGALDCQVKGDI